MANNTLVTVSPTNEGDIDRDRIVDGNCVPDEYFCPICQQLLWKPRSCSSCQHLFCEKCIRTWLDDPNGGRRCPFRCQPYVDRRCPPHVQSILSRLHIHCGNATFGCTQVVPYDRLEYHETVECQYLTQRCVECEKLVLVSKFDEHRQMVGLCIPCPIKCTICQNYIEKVDFRDHFSVCRQKRIDQLNTMAHFNQNLLRVLYNQPIVRNNGIGFFQTIANNVQLVEQQKQMSRFPTTLKGVDLVDQARKQNCGYFYHILIMLEFFISNWSKFPFFLYTITSGGLLATSVSIIGIYIILSGWMKTNICCGSIFLIFSTCCLTYGGSILIQTVSDLTLIFCFLTFSFLLTCSARLPLEIFELDFLFNRPILTTIACCLSLFITKLIFLLIRLYYWYIPIYLAVPIFLLFNFYLTLKVYGDGEVRGPTTTNRLTMPV